MAPKLPDGTFCRLGVASTWKILRQRHLIVFTIQLDLALRQITITAAWITDDKSVSICINISMENMVIGISSFHYFPHFLTVTTK